MGLTIGDDHATLTMSRTELLALPDAVGEQLATDPAYQDEGLPPLFGHAVALRTCVHEVTIAKLTMGDVRLVDVWVGRAGVVAQARQNEPDVEAPVIGLAPSSALDVLWGAIGLRGHAAPSPAAPTTLAELSDSTTAGGDVEAAFVVTLTDPASGARRRAIMASAGDGVRAALDCTTALDEPVELVPHTMPSIVGWLATAVVVPPLPDEEPSSEE